MTTNRWALIAAAAAVALGPCSVARADDEKDTAPPPAAAGAVAEGASSPARPPEEGTSLEGALAGSSGVRVQTMCTNCNIASVSMFGQSGESVRVIQDGLPVLGGLGAIYLLSVMPGEAIAQTEIVRGPGTVLSGSEAGTGAVVVSTRRPGPTTGPFLHVGADAGSLSWASQEVYAGHALGRWGGQLAVTHAESDGSDPNDDGVFDLGAFDRTTFGGSVTVDLTPRSHLRVDGVAYREDQRDSKGGWSGTRFYREDIDIERDSLGAAWEQELDGGGRLSVRARRAAREQVISDDSTGAKKPYMWVDETSRQFEARYERILLDRHVLVAGASYTEFDVEGLTAKSVGPTDQAVIDRIDHAGAFAEVSWTLPRGFDLTTGLRWDDFSHEVFDSELELAGPVEQDLGSAVLPRARLGWKPHETLGLALSVGRSYAAPPPAFERVCCGARFITNIDAKAADGWNAMLDADYVPRRWLRLRAALFRNQIDDYFQKYVLLSIGYIPSYLVVNYDEVEIDGYELSAEIRVRNRLSIGLTGTHLEATFDTPLVARYRGFDLPLAEPGTLPYLPEDTGAAFVTWEDNRRGFELTVEGQYTGEQRIQELPEFGPVTTFRTTPDFWIYNARFRARIWGGLSAFGGVDNIGDEAQLWLDDPRYEYNWGALRGRYWYGGLAYDL
jgi:outer membrane receptor protein involved in Fe transport